MDDHLPGIARLPDIAVRGRRVLVRTDFNTPLVAGRVLDDQRILAGIPTLRWLRAQGASVTVATHLGNPSGPQPELDTGVLRPIVDRLIDGVELLPNLRFDPREEANDPAFAAELADRHDLYVNDAFSVAHRRHASVVGVPAILPSAAGFALVDEVTSLSRFRTLASGPRVLLIGGAKIADKLTLARMLAGQFDEMLVGGLTAVALRAAHRGDEIRLPPADLGAVRAFADSDVPVRLPTDFVHDADGRIADIGPSTVATFGAVLESAGSVLWSGPVGRFEIDEFASGTREVALAIGRSSGRSVAGGGHTAAALRTLGLTDRLDHVSTAGGALLAFMRDGDLPALRALRRSA
ncbi:phosphoglycerate kinase [Nonomuraea sp. NPDC050451]|uniref:phosphoglycerate kinase n=1 Tax=Nonomuraea sp. NPDC050451 TaxID=3364364 RepID=UPI0037B68AB3